MKLFLNHHSSRNRARENGVYGTYGKEQSVREVTVAPPTPNYNIITIGYDCSPAQALRDMNLRQFALPFDWVISSVNSLERCFRDKFSLFHQNLSFNHNKTRLIDHYGFEFPHDYPILKDVLDCSFTSVVKEHTIVDNWADYHAEVCAKYRRRIDRFNAILEKPEPVIVLCRHDIRHIPRLKMLFETYYNKKNVFFVNNTPQKQVFGVYDYTITCNTEENGNWNETRIWRGTLDQAIKKFNK